MQIKRASLFKEQFHNIVFYIAKDKLSAAKSFKNSLNNSINDIVNFPYKYRQSHYHKNEAIRDMTFKAYTIIYRIDEEKELIEIIEIFNKNKPNKKD